MRLLADNIKIQYTESGDTEIVLSVKGRIDISDLKEIISKGKRLDCDIKQYRAKRSLEANGYLWLLSQKIAEALHCTKEEVYRNAIRAVGQFEMLAMKEEAAETFIKVWNSRGLGWYAEEMDSKLEGCKKIIAYYGSSCYDTHAMSVLIDYIVDDAKAIGIETLTPSEIEGLKEGWGK